MELCTTMYVSNYFFTDNDWNYYYNETLSGHQSQWNQLIAEGKAGGTATTKAAG